LDNLLSQSVLTEGATTKRGAKKSRRRVIDRKVAENIEALSSNSCSFHAPPEVLHSRQNLKRRSTAESTFFNPVPRMFQTSQPHAVIEFDCNAMTGGKKSTNAKYLNKMVMETFHPTVSYFASWSFLAVVTLEGNSTGTMDTTNGTNGTDNLASRLECFALEEILTIETISLECRCLA
jgi:hypothetical protein